MPASLSLSSGLLSPDREPEPPHSAASDRTGGSVYDLAAGSIKPDLLNVLQIKLHKAYHSQSRHIDSILNYNNTENLLIVLLIG